MNEPFKPEGGSILNLIREGMDVFDVGNHRIGTVREVFFGEAGETNLDYGQGAADVSKTPLREGDSLAENIAEPFEENVPDTVRNRLLQQGYVRIDTTGLFSSDLYALPDQIGAITDGGVKLTAAKDDLIDL